MSTNFWHNVSNPEEFGFASQSLFVDRVLGFHRTHLDVLSSFKGPMTKANAYLRGPSPTLLARYFGWREAVLLSRVAIRCVS